MGRVREDRGATVRIWSSVRGPRERSTGEPEAKRLASCMVLLLIKMAFQKRNRIPRFEPAFLGSGCPVTLAQGAGLSRYLRLS